MKYIKKPVEIEAVKWNGNRVSEVTEWISKALDENVIIRYGNEVHINTLEGVMKASPGDYIIKGVNGELYPCKPDIFEKTYQAGSVGDISDGYHSFNELYEYRMLYNAAFFNELAKSEEVKVCKSWKHSDGQDCFGGGWFIVMAELPTGQISNHYEAKDWNLFRVPEVLIAPEWDGHTPKEAAERLKYYVHTRLMSKNLGDAVRGVKHGMLARRRCWNGKFIFMRPADTLSVDFVVNKVKSLPVSFRSSVANSKNMNEQIQFGAYLCMRDSDGSVINGWVPTQEDILADDWIVSDIIFDRPFNSDECHEGCCDPA